MGAGQLFFAAIFFLAAIASDLSDGYFARRFNVASNFGSKYDAAVDFIFIMGVFTYFVIQGLYPLWILAIVGFMFAQFVITSRIYGVNYDPLGKYYGGFLYGAIGLTIVLFETRFTHNIILLLAGITVITLISRLIFLVRKTKK
jgi:phosphatidylglycerophosphate synthase